MKNHHKLALLLLTSLLPLAGCEKILEPKIYNQLEASKFPQSEADVVSAFVPFYAQFTTDFGTYDSRRGVYDLSFSSPYLGYAWSTTTQTDEGKDIFNQPPGAFLLGPSTYTNNSGLAFYDRISFVARATDLIAKVTNSSVANKDAYVAEAKGLRAWFMFILYDLYGPVSVKLDPAALDGTEAVPRPTQAEYVAAMEADLKTAIAGLPDKHNGTANWGRISKGVMRMVLFKLYMHDKEWAKAEAVGKDLLGMGYALNPSYKDVFVTPQNSELIYAVPGNQQTTNIWFACLLPSDAATVLGLDVTRGDKYKLIEMPWAFYDKYAPTDARLQTIATSYTKADGSVVNRAAGLTGAIPLKYTTYTANTRGFDFVLYRYADVLLGMAEIANELGGPSGAARGYLKQVTDRAGTTAAVPALGSKEDFRKFILDERGRELYYEFGIRRQDLIRNGTFISNARARGITAAADHMVLYPIPSDVIIQSGGVIKQNPGY